MLKRTTHYQLMVLFGCLFLVSITHIHMNNGHKTVCFTILFAACGLMVNIHICTHTHTHTHGHIHTLMICRCFHQFIWTTPITNTRKYKMYNAACLRKKKSDFELPLCWFIYVCVILVLMLLLLIPLHCLPFTGLFDSFSVFFFQSLFRFESRVHD